MSDGYDWGRDQARDGGSGWRNDFSASESAGYHYQKSLNEQAQFVRRQQEEAEEAERARRRSTLSAEPASFGASGGGGASSSGSDGGEIIGLVVAGGIALLCLLPFIIVLALFLAACLAAVYVYDLCRHRQGLRDVDTVFSALADDFNQASGFVLRWLSTRCRRGQAGAEALALRLAHRANVADSLPLSTGSRRTRAARVVLARMSLRLRALLARMGGWLLQGLAAGLEYLQDE